MGHNTFSCCLFVALSISTLSSKANANVGQLSGVNDVRFQQSQYNNTFAGNGFLIEYMGEHFAVTVKHVLFEAKTPKMASVSLADEVASWSIHPLAQPDNAVQLGQLLNDNPNEPLDMQVLNSDWLVFKIKNNSSTLRPLTIRHEPLQAGETLTAYGCSYSDKETCTQNAYKGQFKSYEANNLRIDIGKVSMAELRGLSGSPVIDQNGQLVGIVSNVLPDKENDGFDFAPARIDYLLEVLNN